METEAEAGAASNPPEADSSEPAYVGGKQRDGVSANADDEES
jgi:hypothetical protein